MTIRKISDGRVYPFYSIKELSGYIGLSVSGTRRFLYRLNVPCHLHGKKILVYLCDMQTHCPELYNSILEANQLNAMIERSKAVEDEDLHVKEQFQ